MSKRGFGGRLWCIVGDFNAVKSSAEKRGNSLNFLGAETRGFQEFIEDINLIDLPILGNRFTWFQFDGLAMSKPDRFLLPVD